MSLAVAGLKKDELKERTRKLSAGEWSGFPPAYRLAFRLGDRLTREPASVVTADVEGLTEAFGRHRAVDVIFYVAWGNYMTRVGDAFQLPLERENVFQDRSPQPEPPPSGKDGSSGR